MNCAHPCTSIVLIIFAAALAPLSRAEKGDFWLDINVASKHSEQRYIWERRVREYNEKNLGLGATYELTEWCEVKGGWFENSYERTSVYALLNAKWNRWRYRGWFLAPGLAAGIVSGYDNTPERTGVIAPWGMVTLSIGAVNRWKINLGYIPSRIVMRGAVEVATLQVSLKL